MSEYTERIMKLAYNVRLAQMEQQPAGAGAAMGGAAMAGGPTMPPAGAMEEAPDAGMEEGAPEEEPMEEGGEDEELGKPTPWIVKYDEKNKNFWIGKVFPDEYIDQAVKFFAQYKSVPKEHVREYFEKLMEGKQEKMPPEMEQAPETTGEEAPPPAPLEGGAEAAGGMVPPGGMGATGTPAAPAAPPKMPGM